MAMLTNATSQDLRVDDWAFADLGSGQILGVITEDRGSLGVGGERILRFEWTPSQSSDALEFELAVGDLRLAISRKEWLRALARMQEFSFHKGRSPASPDGPLAKVAAAQKLLDKAIAAALERGAPRDFELVHRYCVENLGAAALASRRAWSNSGRHPQVNPTLDRLPAMIENETSPNRDWLLLESPIPAWYEALNNELEVIRDAALSDRETGPVLISAIGSCADMAAWVRTTHHLGD